MFCFFFALKELNTLFILDCDASSQVYFYSFEVLGAAGIPHDKLAYAALGTGLCELITSTACVSPVSLIYSIILLFSSSKFFFLFKLFTLTDPYVMASPSVC